MNGKLSIGRWERKPIALKKLIALFAVVASTACAWATIGGSGTSTDPYTINSADDLETFRDNVNGGNTYSGKFIKLTADIDLQGSASNQWTPIGTDTASFAGTLDGAGHTIKGLYIESSTLSELGLFSTNEGTIRDLCVEGRLDGGKSYSGIGAVCGRNRGGTVERCFVRGNFIASDKAYAGCVCGLNYANGRITDCYNLGDVSGSGSIVEVGGICGDNYSGGVIERCYNFGKVSGSGTSTKIGGVCGFNDGSSGGATVKDSFGVTGKGATVAVGTDSGTVTNTTMIDEATFQNEATFTAKEWDFTSVWEMSTWLERPVLRSCQEKPVFIGALAQLEAFRDEINAGNRYEDQTVILTADIDLHGSESNQWTPIGKDYNTPFSGTFDGAGHKIKGLYINNSPLFDLGLFGDNNKGTIKNLCVDGVIGGAGAKQVGGICGVNNGGTIERCYAKGAVSGVSDRFTGGICGLNDNGGIIRDCYNLATVSGTGDAEVGGICGDNYDGGTIERCYNFGQVSGSGIDRIGSICGFNDGESSAATVIKNSFGVTGKGASVAVGENNYGTVTNTSMIDEATFKTQGIFTAKGWDFSDVWEMSNGWGRPVLRACRELEPVFIGTLAELEAFRDAVNARTNYEDKTVILTADIDLQGGIGNMWTPIGNGTGIYFEGTFDGAGHTVKGLYITSESRFTTTFSALGLFGINKGIIRNLCVEGILAGENTPRDIGNSCVGAVCGGNEGGTIERCYAKGSFSGSNTVSTISVGGVCGANAANGRITDCYSIADVSGSGSKVRVGGVCGWNSSEGTIERCYNFGKVSGSATDIKIGSVCGYNDGSRDGAAVKDSFGVTGKGASVAVGEDSGTVTNTEMISEAAFKTKSTFTAKGWDFSNVWEMSNGWGRPVLRACREPEPVFIGTLAELEAFRDEVNAGTSYADKIVILTADIDLKGSESNQWTPIGVEEYGEYNAFAGIFDGAGHTIKGLYINDEDGWEYAGLFHTNSGTIRNLYVDGVVEGGCSTSAGAICGKNRGGTIERCYAKGSFNGGTYIGGICGFNTGNGIIRDCYNLATVSGAGDADVGGICGENYDGGTIERCYNFGQVSGSGSNIEIGSVCGFNNGYPDGATIKDSFGVTGKGASSVVGEDSGTFSGNLMISEEKFKTQSTFTAKGWDFLNVWEMSDYWGRPVLRSCREADPVFIGTLAELESFRDAVNAGNTYEGVTVVLTADIDLQGSESNQWEPIGTYNVSFAGTFDGAGRTIKGLYITNEDGWAYTGLFYSNSGTIRNLCVEGVVKGGYATFIGAICARNKGGTIEGCYAKGSFSATNYGQIGGVCGYNTAGGIIRDCYNLATLSSTGNDAAVGGICGWNDKGGIIERCYNFGEVSASGTNSKVGSVCGFNDGSAGGATVSDSFGVTGKGASSVVGADSGTVSNNSMISEAAFKTQSTFTAKGWNFNTTWEMSGELGRPVLQVYNHGGEIEEITIIGLDEDLMPILADGLSLADFNILWTTDLAGGAWTTSTEAELRAWIRANKPSSMFYKVTTK